MKNKTEHRQLAVMPVVATLFAAGMLLAVPASAEKTVGSDASSGSSAQTEKSPAVHRWARRSLSSVYLQGGVSHLDMDAVNGRLERNGYTPLENPAVPIGFGFKHHYGRLIAGFDWNFLLNQNPDAPDSNIRMDLRNWYWQLNYGADLLKQERFSIYPLLGVGLGHTNIWITEESGTSFDGALASPARSIQMSQTSLVLSATLGIDYRIKMRESARKTDYITVGLRGGYLYSPFAGEWRTHAAQIQNGPDRGINGAILQLTLGLSHKRTPPKNAAR